MHGVEQHMSAINFPPSFYLLLQWKKAAYQKQIVTEAVTILGKECENTFHLIICIGAKNNQGRMIRES